jgi:hypothetical protein
VVSGKEEEKGRMLGGGSRAAGSLERLPARPDKVSAGFQRGARGESCDGFTSVLRPGFGEGR